MAKTSGKPSSNTRQSRPAARSGRTATSSAKEAETGDIIVSLVRFVRNVKARVAIGLLGFFFVAFSIISVLTFLWTGGSDQSFIQPHPEGEVAEPTGREVANLFGLPGARWSDYLFNDLLGFGILFVLAFGVYLVYHIIWKANTRRIRYVQFFARMGFWALWVAVAGAGLQELFPTKTFLRWGGAKGEALYQWITNSLGVSGLIFTLLAVLILFLVLTSDRFLGIVQNPHLPRPEMNVRMPRANWDFLAPLKGLWRLIWPTEGDEEKDEEQPTESALQEEDLWRDEVTESTTPVDPDTIPEDEAPEEGGDDSQANTQPESATGMTVPLTPAAAPSTSQPTKESGDMIVEEAPADDLVEDQPERTTPYVPGIQLPLYQKPSTDLLRDYELGATPINMEEIEFNKQKIIDTLASFKMHVTPQKATVGPTVTLYEVVPDPGVKVSRIKSMEDDIAMSLKSEGVRIIAPMPGLGTIGIEVPNSSAQTVSMRSILASRKYREQQEKMELPVGIGKTITNEPFVFDLAKMPHLLIAGATGQGKSVGLNALITSLLYSKRPEELKFVMVDPKMLEFSIYEEIERHFLAKLPDADRAIITDMSRVVATLNSLCVEMDNRYRLLQTAGRAVRNIKEYNEQVRSGGLTRQDGHEILPYIVLIVDEFADLMMTVGKEVEQPIARLAQKARAAGIHMVIATQRPSTDVITGLIKANFPARIAFKVFSMVDSRTVLDSPGANQLIGRGDMLFYQGKDMIRVQCAFMDTPETEAIVEHIARQESLGHAYELPEYIPEGEDAGRKEFNASEKDSLFDDVARMVVQTQVGSTSNIQRKFNIGYNRAGRLMDQLEGAEIVGPQEGSKPREVLIKDLQSLEYKLQQLS